MVEAGDGWGASQGRVHAYDEAGKAAGPVERSGRALPPLATDQARVGRSAANRLPFCRSCRPCARAGGRRLRTSARGDVGRILGLGLRTVSGRPVPGSTPRTPMPRSACDHFRPLNGRPASPAPRCLRRDGRQGQASKGVLARAWTAKGLLRQGHRPPATGVSRGAVRLRGWGCPAPCPALVWRNPAGERAMPDLPAHNPCRPLPAPDTGPEGARIETPDGVLQLTSTRRRRWSGCSATPARDHAGLADALARGSATATSLPQAEWRARRATAGGQGARQGGCRIRSRA